MSEVNVFTQAMMNVAGDLGKYHDSAVKAERGPNPPLKFGEERMSSKANWQKDWANKTEFERTMELDRQGQGAILGNLQGYNGGKL